MRIISRLTGAAFLAVITGGWILPLPASTPDPLASLVTVEGDGGVRGSGFLVRSGDLVHVVTNARVVHGCSRIVFKTSDLRERAVGPLEIAENADLLRAEVKDADLPVPLAGKLANRVTAGDEIVLAGEGSEAGAPRRIRGNVLAIEPGRITIATGFHRFVGGTPILLETTGEVIGVATHPRLPPYHRYIHDEDQPRPLPRPEDLRRYGLRLDTVSKWIPSPEPDGLLAEGRRLAVQEAIDRAVFQMTWDGTEALLKQGLSAELEARPQPDPGLAELAAAVDTYVTAHRAAKTPAEREAPLLAFFARLRELTPVAAPDSATETYTGWHSVCDRERFESREGLHEWLDYRQERASRHDWTLDVLDWEWPGGPPADVSKIHLPLVHEVDWKSEPGDRHHITCPDTSRPGSLRNLHWVLEDPTGEISVAPMNYLTVSFSTVVNGLHRAHVEHRVGDVHQIVSNVVTFTVNDLPPPNSVIDFSEAPPLAPTSPPGSAPDWAKLAERIAEGSYAMSRLVGMEPATSRIRDLPPRGGVLVGLELFLVPHRSGPNAVGGFRPVYLEESGQKSGTYWGNPRVDESFRLVANPGYAIGKLSTRFDGYGVRAIKVRFDRIRGLALDPSDSYESDWIGEGRNTRIQSTDTNGRLPVGIVGKHHNEIDGLRLVCLTDEGATPPPVEPPPIPEVFTSADEIISIIPLRLVDLTRRPETRKDGVARINEFLAKNVKGKRFEGSVTVEVSAPLSDRSPNKFRIKAPDTRITANEPIRTRLWVYFLAPDVPSPAPAPGSDVRVSGHIGRCDVNGDKFLLLNNDIQGAKILPSAESGKPQAPPVR